MNLPRIPEEELRLTHLHVNTPSSESDSNDDSYPSHLNPFVNANDHGQKHQQLSDSESEHEIVRPTSPDEDPEQSDEPVALPPWSSMLGYLSTMSGPALLVLADLRAVMLVQSAISDTYDQALSDVLMAWQLVRTGLYSKDSRVWLWKRRTFRQPPFPRKHGVAGFCIRRRCRQGLAEAASLRDEHRIQRLTNFLIEYTGYNDDSDGGGGVGGGPVVRRINSKKDERVERYKGKSWQTTDPVLVHWDNTGCHRSHALTAADWTLKRRYSSPVYLPMPTDITPAAKRHRSASALNRNGQTQGSPTTPCLPPGTLTSDDLVTCVEHKVKGTASGRSISTVMHSCVSSLDSEWYGSTCSEYAHDMMIGGTDYAR